MSILTEVKDAYADCRLPFEKACGIRNLNFRASAAVSRDEAKKILTAAKVLYNEFRPELLDKFPEDCLITIAREGSVCLYVQGSSLPSGRAVLADERDQVGAEVRYWWD